MDSIHRLAHFLRWFSVGLGLTEFFVGCALDQFLGTYHGEKTLRFFGLRESAAGVGIPSRPVLRPLWVWARVADDAFDLAALDVYHALKLTQERGTALVQ